MKKEIKLIEVKEKELQKALTELDKVIYYVEDMKPTNPELGCVFDNIHRMLICNVEDQIRKMMIEAYTKQASLSMMEAAKLTIELAE